MADFGTTHLTASLPFVSGIFFIISHGSLSCRAVGRCRHFSPSDIGNSSDATKLGHGLRGSSGGVIIAAVRGLGGLVGNRTSLPVCRGRIIFVFSRTRHDRFNRTRGGLGGGFGGCCRFNFANAPVFPRGTLNTRAATDIFNRRLRSCIVASTVHSRGILGFGISCGSMHPRFRTVRDRRSRGGLATTRGGRLLLRPSHVRRVSGCILGDFGRGARHLGKDNGNFGTVFTIDDISTTGTCCRALDRLRGSDREPLGVTAVFSCTTGRRRSTVNSVTSRNFRPATVGDDTGRFLDDTVGSCGRVFGAGCNMSDGSFRGCCHSLTKHIVGRSISLLVIINVFLANFSTPALGALCISGGLHCRKLVRTFSEAGHVCSTAGAFNGVIAFHSLRRTAVSTVALFNSEGAGGIILRGDCERCLRNFASVTANGTQHNCLRIVGRLRRHFPGPSRVIGRTSGGSFTGLFNRCLHIRGVLRGCSRFTDLGTLRDVSVASSRTIRIFGTRRCLASRSLTTVRDVSMPTRQRMRSCQSACGSVHS